MEEVVDMQKKLFNALEEYQLKLHKETEELQREKEEWIKLENKLKISQLGKKITLDVGGSRFSTFKSNLLSQQETFFTAMLSGRFNFQLEEDGSIFIDRDPFVFRHILNFLRGQKINFSLLSPAEKESLIEDADFYQISALSDLFSLQSNIITTSQAKIFHQWIENFGPPSSWQLKYQGTKDGFTASAFHSKCDNLGPSLTIIKTNTGHIFGGFTSISWNSTGNYYKDSNAFIFTIVNPHNIPPTKYLITNSSAIYCGSSYGPTFGGGHDICITNNANQSTSSYSSFPSSFLDSTGKGNSTFTSCNFVVAEIEVFLLQA